MRVIAGEYGGRKLKSLVGDNTRPTSDKIKGSIFNMIGPYFDGEKVLDLYAGSGSLAIEAVSRGASYAFCVDKNYGAIRVIQENIQMTKEIEKFKVKKMDAQKALFFFQQEKQLFDIVFLDPPYAHQNIIEEMNTMKTLGLLNEGALVVCETDISVQLPDEIEGYQLKKRQKYGRTLIVIYEFLNKKMEG